MDIGFIGLGKMGQAIATRLVAAGHRVRVWNRSQGPVRELADLGAEVAAQPADTVRAEVLMSMLADDTAMRSVILDQGVLEAAKPGLVHLNLATISVALARELAELHRRRDVEYVAAPVFGRPEVAAEGKLNIVVAGSSAAIARARPALEAVGQKVWPVGERPEAASAVKAAGNFMIASAIEAMGEASALARAHGVVAREFLEIMTSTLFAAPVYKGYGAMISAERYQPAGFAVTLALKDIRLALSAGDASHVPMPFAGVLRDSLLELIATGSADQDWASLARLAAQRAGLERAR
ncbi:MAG TPA: NAD(P)-dependent oxidoreductase [Steroidobacteraceae bacterium]|jgi:3-hydroxyisobutyrate dehydrogenase-like beta-hydroxyacid dehydrogenase